MKEGAEFPRQQMLDGPFNLFSLQVICDTIALLLNVVLYNTVAVSAGHALDPRQPVSSIVRHSPVADEHVMATLRVVMIFKSTISRITSPLSSMFFQHLA